MNSGWAVEQARSGGKPRLPDWPPGAYAAIAGGMFAKFCAPGWAGAGTAVGNDGYLRDDWELLAIPIEELQQEIERIAKRLGAEKVERQ